VFPAAAVQRLSAGMLNWKKDPVQGTSSLRRHSAPVNGLLKVVCALELPLFRLNRLFGLSVFCLARKPPTAIGSRQGAVLGGADINRALVGARISSS
jgi:hypothetical protein